MIRLNEFYRNANGVQIPQGDYADNDPRLQGLASYLLSTGQAESIHEPEATQDDAPQIPDEQVVEAPDDESAWKASTELADLRAELDALGIPYDKRWGKARLYELWLQQQS